jgi:hypothetical protein
MNPRLALAALLLSGCQAVVGSGRVTSTTRDVSAFRRISIASGITANATTGSRSVTIRTDDNLQDLVETVVEGDTLTVRLRPSVLLASRKELAADITNDLLEGVDASGGAHVTSALTPVGTLRVTGSGGSTIEASPVAATVISLDASGGSDLTLSGAATDGTVVSSGGSDVTIRQLPLDTLHVDISGGSTLAARVALTLSGDVSGGSTATIIGTPSSSVTTSGGSRVTTGAQ